MRVTTRTYLKVGFGCYVNNNLVQQIIENVAFGKQPKLLELETSQRGGPAPGYVILAHNNYDACLTQQINITQESTGALTSMFPCMCARAFLVCDFVLARHHKSIGKVFARLPVSLTQSPLTVLWR